MLGLVFIGIVLIVLIILLSIKKILFIVFPLAIIIVFCLFFRIVNGFFPMPLGVRHFIHLLVPPKDMYQPIILDKFLFTERGFSRTYSLQIKYLDFYDCGFLIDGEIPTDYRFSGKIRFEFLNNNMPIYEKIITSSNAIWTSKLSLFHFQIPFSNKYVNNIAIRVTVIEPDLNLKKYQDSLRLFVAVSSIP